MRILTESFDKETYFDILVSEQDFEALKEFNLLSQSIEILGQKINLGLKIDQDEENDDW